MFSKRLWAIIIALLLVGGIVGGLIYAINDGTVAKEISLDKAQDLVNTQFDEMAITSSMKLVADSNNINVNNMELGDEKNIILDCSVTTLDVYSVLSPQYNRFLSCEPKNENGSMFKTITKLKQEFEGDILEIVSSAPVKTVDCKIEIFDTHKGYKVYAAENVINAVFGDVLTIEKEVMAIETYVDSEGAVQEIKSANLNKALVKCVTPRFDKEKPDASNAVGRAWNSLKKDFHRNFIEKDRWKTIVDGLWNTLKLTFFSLIIGIVLGFLVAFVRCTYLKQQKKGIILKICNAICQVYLSVIRGTPAIVQITIIYFVIFMPMGVDKFIAAVVCFGINSGAYVAEIVRGGIMSVDEGQTEAGRSLGFGYMATMFHIVFPQAFKAVLPALANEFVVLLKETSIAFYIGIGDIMYSVNAIRAATYTPFMPLIAAAVVYFILVVILSKLVSLLERRLRKSER